MGMDRDSFLSPPSVALSDTWLSCSSLKRREKARTVTGEGEAAHERQHRADMRPQLWPDGPWHIACTPPLAYFAIAADQNVRCSNFLAMSGNGRVRGVGVVFLADGGGAVKLREMGRGGEELQMHGLQCVVPLPPARKRGEGKVLESNRSLVLLADPPWCLLHNHSPEKS
jgi:hypothetical protein